MINLPIFRAKKLGTKDEYVIGYLLQDCFGFYIIQTDNALRCETLNQESVEIDHQTLSISFSDMLDSRGNKIFASLSEDGKGGDILLEESRLMCNLKIDESVFREFTAIHTMNGNRFTNEKILSDIGNYRDKHFKGYDIMIYDFFMMKKRNIKIIGIQE